MGTEVTSKASDTVCWALVIASRVLTDKSSETSGSV